MSEDIISSPNIITDYPNINTDDVYTFLYSFPLVQKTRTCIHSFLHVGW